ncbi:MAG: hypothetical protein QM581_06525 [Pseudomonas sp.]
MNEIDSTNVYAAAESAASATPASPTDGPSLTATRDGVLASVTAATSPGDPLQPPGEAGADPQVTLDQLVNEPQSMAQVMYADGGHVLGDVGQYHGKLGETFDSLDRVAREDGTPEDIASIAEGRQVAAELAHELRVPVSELREVNRELADWSLRLRAGDTLSAADRLEVRHRTEAELKAEWGREYTARMQLARQVYQRAVVKAPWLKDLMNAGAGDSPTVLRHFAAIGLRAARRGS